MPYLIHSASKEPDLPPVEGRRLRADQAEAARPDPKVDLVPLSYVPQHLTLAAVPGQSQVHKVAHGHAEVDPVEEPNEVAGLRQHDAEDGCQGDDHVNGVDP